MQHYYLEPFLFQLRQEKVTLEQTLEREQEFQVNKLIRRIERLEAETVSKQQVLEQVWIVTEYYIFRISFFSSVNIIC